LKSKPRKVTTSSTILGATDFKIPAKREYSGSSSSCVGGFGSVELEGPGIAKKESSVRNNLVKHNI